MEIFKDSKGRFKKGYTSSDVPIETRIKVMYSLQESWKNRKDYIGDIKSIHPYIYNVWRGIRFTAKGKSIGNSEDWNVFRNFYNDVSPLYKKGMLFRRLDTTKEYNKSNFIWINREEEFLLKSNLIVLKYNNEELSLKQLADKYSRSLSGIKSRYHKYKDVYTIEEIIFGKRRLKKKPTIDVKELSSEQLKRNKASKMVSSYRIKDNKKGFYCDITVEQMLNIMNQPCIYCGDTNKIGCDRIDNNKGHTIDNVVPCCVECNKARNDNFSFDEMKIIGKTIMEVKQMRLNKL